MQERLDIFLSTDLGVSRSQARKLIKEGRILVKGVCPKPGLLVDEGVKYELLPASKEEVADFSVDFEVPILYEDEDILVVNKPAGLVVHPAPSVKEVSLVDWLKAKGYALADSKMRAGLVHRIDKGTSGALLVAKNDEAHAKLSAQLQDKSMGRFYLAAIDLGLKNPRMISEKSIGRAINNRLKKQSFAALPEGEEVVNGRKKSVGGVSVPKDARRAKSEFVSLIEGKPSLIAAKLYTGRTHQIRAHLEDMNRHILGDDLYGFKGKCERICLHAYILYFTHPSSGEAMQVKAPLDKDLWAIFLKHFSKGELDEKVNPSYILRLFS